MTFISLSLKTEDGQIPSHESVENKLNDIRIFFKRRKSSSLPKMIFPRSQSPNTHGAQVSLQTPAWSHLLAMTKQQAPLLYCTHLRTNQVINGFHSTDTHEEEARPHLNRMNPGLGASYTFYCGDSSTVQRTDGEQTGIGWIMSSECKREARVTLYPVAKGTEHSLSTSNMEVLYKVPGFAYAFHPSLKAILQK